MKKKLNFKYNFRMYNFRIFHLKISKIYSNEIDIYKCAMCLTNWYGFFFQLKKMHKLEKNISIKRKIGK